MSKLNRITYRIATGWLALGMLSTGIVQLLKTKEETDLFIHLGYPLYFLPLLAVWKFLGVAAVLIPKLPVLKEWAYAGFFFAMSGAVISHWACNDTVKDFFGPLLLLLLTAVSWYLRPVDRKMKNTVTKQ